MENTMSLVIARSSAPAGALRLALPKGRMQEGVFALLADAGIEVRVGARGYRPRVSIEGIEAKILKPQSVVRMLAAGSRDVGFAGADWVRELGADLVEVLDTGLDAVRMVAAAPASMLAEGRLRRGPVVIASEYERLTRQWIASGGIDACLVLSYGATEVFPPEDADGIVDITATGETLREHNLVVFDELMRSSTRLYASRSAFEDGERREGVERLVTLVSSALEARRRVMVEVNVRPEALERVIKGLPCMREPTIAPLHGGAGFAVKAAVLRGSLAALLPDIKARGGTDIVVSQLSQIVP